MGISNAGISDARDFWIVNWSIDSRTRCISIDPAWQAVTGQTTEAALGHGWFDALHEDDRDQLKAELDGAAKAERPFQLVARLRRADGEYRWAMAVGAPRRDNKAFIGFAGSIMDYHEPATIAAERERLDAMLRESEERLSLSQSFAKMGAWWWDVPSGRTEFNATYYELYGLPAGAPHSYDDFLALVHPDDRALVKARMSDALAGKRPYDVEYRVRRFNDGAELWLAAKGKAAFSASSAPLRVTGVVFDITERKRAEEVLRESEERHAFLLKLSDAMRAASGENAIGAVGVRMLGEHLAVDRCWIARYSHERGLGFVGPDYCAPDLVSAAGEYRLADFPDAMGLVADQSPTVCDVASDPRLSELDRASMAAMNVGAYMAAILRKGDREYVWNICVATRGARHWSKGEMRLLEDVTERAWAAMERARSEEALRRSQERQAFLLKLSDALRSLADPTEIQEKAVTILGAQLGVSRAVYAEFAVAGEEEFVVIEREYRTSGANSIVGRHEAEQFGSDLSELRAGRPVVVADTEQETQSEAARALWRALGVRARLGAPLIKGGRLVAGLGVHDASPRVWTDEEIGLVTETGERTWAAVERARAEAHLRASEARFSQFGQAASDVLWIRDARHMNFEYVSPAFAKIYGVDAARLVGHFDFLRWLRLLHPRDRKNVVDSFRRVRKGERVVHEFRVKRPDGEERWLRETDFPLFDAAGRVERIAGISQDVSELKRNEIALRLADRRKDEFLATLAHELRNPLAPIRNAAYVLMRKNSLSAQDRQLLEMIQRQTDHLVRLVDDLLEVSRISRGVIDLQRESVAMETIVRGAIEACQSLLEKKRHRLSVNAPTEPLFVCGDPVRLTQVVTNLINNAAKYTPASGMIDVVLEADRDMIVLRVRDNGVGIAADMAPRVFELFTQVKREAGSFEVGLGIGLALARQLVELHGGAIEARSPGVGLGSEFIVRLPRSMDVQPKLSASRLERVAVESLRVLVIDDDHDVGDSLGMLLESLGAEVKVVQDGLSGIAAVDAFEPDLIFLDIGMPELDGFETARRIKAVAHRRPFKLVALTGWGQAEDRSRVKEACFDTHLTKPASIETIDDLLRKTRSI